LDTAVEATLEELLVFWKAHQRMAAIIMTETLKNSNEIPLFTLWDYNINRPMDNLSQNANMTPDDIMNIIEGTFFMMFLPTYSFAMLEGKWCQHYHADSAKVRRTFLTLMTETCKSKIFLKR
jgi:hypothetical protein